MPIGRVSDVFATSVDVFPTFLAAAGVKGPSHAVMDGTVRTLLIAMTIVMGITYLICMNFIIKKMNMMMMNMIMMMTMNMIVMNIHRFSFSTGISILPQLLATNTGKILYIISTIRTVHSCNSLFHHPFQLL